MDTTGSGREALMQALNAKLLREQNLPLGIAAGLGAAILGSLLWTGITVFTHSEFGLVAIAIGAGVGYAMRFAGKGVTKVFGVIGAVLSLLSCVAGEFFSAVELAATNEGIGFSEMLSKIDPGAAFQAIVTGSSIMTYIIWAIAVYEGYKLSFRKLTPQEIQEAGLAAPAPPTT